MDVRMKSALLVGCALAAFSVSAANDWYVDANYGNDEWDGSCKYADRDEDAKKGPKLTLKAAMEIPTLANDDIVHAARGVYDKGEIWNGGVSNRVVISKNIGLVGDEGRDVTFIDGFVSSEQACGNGSDAVRCVKFTTAGKAYVKGFTIRNGRTQGVSETTWDYGGGCVSVCGGTAVVDCIITNGNASYRGVIAGWSGATMIGCRIYAQEKKNGRKENYTTYGCFDFINCIVGGTIYGASTGGVCLNSSFEDGPDKTEAAYNCYMYQARVTKLFNCRYQNALGTTVFDESAPSFKVTAQEANLEAGSYRPLRGSVLINAGDDALYATALAKIPEAWRGFATVDYEGLARFRGASVDCGAYEYGSRPSQMTEILTDNPAFALTAVSDGTYADQTVVAIPAGESLAAAWSLASGEVTSNAFTIVVEAGEGATLRIYLDGASEPAWTVTAAGERTIAYRAGRHTLRFESAGGTSSVKAVTTDVKTPYFVKPDGDDTADGKTFATARRTLKAAMEIPGLAAGDVVYAAPGIYAEGEMWDGNNSNRVIIAAGVGLVAYAGPAETAIEGAWAPTDDHTGPEAVRCAYVKGTSFIAGFTLRNGATAATLSSGTNDNYLDGGNVWTADGGTVIDCVVTNGVAKFRGGGAGSLYKPGGNYIRCFFNGNVAGEGTAPGAAFGNFYNCVFRGGNDVYGSSVSAVNCAFLDSATIRGNSGTAAGMVYNSIIAAGDGGLNRYIRCLLKPTEADIVRLGSVIEDGTLIGQTGLASLLDDDYRPVSGSLPVDFGDPNHYLTNFPSAYARFAGVDFAGGQRVYNGAIDAGAGEYDWRGVFAKRLAKRGVEVTAAGANATTNALAGVDIVEGEPLEFRISLKTAGTCSFSVTGPGTPCVRLGSVELIGAEGSYSFEGEAGTSYDVTVSVTGGGATVSSVLIPKTGVLLLLR